MANVVTYFGDVTTVGNTVMFQNLTSQGNYSIFSGNVNPVVNLGSNLGSASATFGQVFLTASNVVTMNATTIPGTAGINVATDSVTGLLIAGNAYGSNSISSQNVIATTSANVTTLNTSFIQTSVGILNNPTTGATLNIFGNATATVAFSGGNVLAVTSANVASLNTAAIFGTSNLVGINTPASGATLSVAGNVYASNALSAPSVFATANANVASLNTAAIFGTTGLVGINTTASGASLSVGNVNASNAFTGNIWASNALSAPNVFTTNANAVSLNTSFIFTSTGFVGVNTTGGAATLNVFGNVYVSNGIGATNVFPTMNANIVTTNVTYMNLVTAGIGINGPAQAGTVLTGGAPFFVGGTLSGDAAPVNDAPTSNLALQLSTSSTSYVNYGLTSPVHVNINTTGIFVEAWIYATTTTGLINIASYGNGTSSGWYMQVRPDAGGSGDGLYVNHSLKTVNAYGTFAANQWTYIAFAIPGSTNGRIYAWISSGATSGSSISTTNSGMPAYSASDPFYLGAVNGVGGLANGNLYIRDLRVISGATITTTGTFTQDQAPFAASVPSYVTGTSLAYSWGLQASSNLYQAPAPLVKVAGNVWCSNAFQTPSALATNVLAVTTSLDSAATKQIFSPAAGGIIGVAQVPTVGSATLQITGNLFASNALQSSNINASTSANVTSTNVLVITNSVRRVGVNKAAPTANLDVAGNVFASNALQSPVINVSTSANVTTLNTSLTITNSSLLVGLNNANPSSNLSVSGNVFVSNAITDGSVNKNLPVVAFTGSGPGGNVYTSVSGGVTYTATMDTGVFETTAHPAWRAFNFPTTSGGSAAPSKFILFEGETITTSGIKLSSPNGRFYLILNTSYYLYLTDSISGGIVWDWNTIGVNYASLQPTTITLLPTGYLTAYNAAGAVVWTSPNTTTGYGPYRFTIENSATLVLYDRYDTILWSTTTSPSYLNFGFGASPASQFFGSNNQPYTLFTSSGTFTVPSYTGGGITANVYVVGGGGGGGGCTFTGASGGGGGGGGVIVYTNITLGPGTYQITIGAAGTGAINNQPNGALNGGNTTFQNIVGGTAINATAIGGGAGSSNTPIVVAAASGGSGGGGSGSSTAAAAGTVGQGNSGGAGYNDAINFSGGGGGGYAAAGGAGTAILGGVGGNGIMPVQWNVPLGCGGGGAVSGSSNVASGGSAGGVMGGGRGAETSSLIHTASYYGNGGGGGLGGNGTQGCVLIEYTTFGTLQSSTYGASTLAGSNFSINFSATRPFLPTSVIVQAPDFINSYNSPNSLAIFGSPDGVNYTVLGQNTPNWSLVGDYDYVSIQIPSSPPYKYFTIAAASINSTTFSTPVNQIIFIGKLLAGEGTWTSNSITMNTATANIIAITGPVGINTSTGLNSTLQIQGNAYVSNALSGSIIGPLANVTTTSNIRSVYGTSGQVGIGTSTGLGANIQIEGNVWASNALSGNVRTTFANVTTISNIRYIYGTSGQVGIGTSTGLGANLQIQGNVWASNTLTSPNVIAISSLSYNEDLARRAPHSIPSAANATTIQNWIAASCNTTQKVGWSVATSNVTFNTSTVGITGSALYSSSLLGPDGRVYFTPASATSIGVFNPKTNEFSAIVPTGGASLAGTFKYGSSVACPNGNIFFISNTSTTSLIFNPVDKTATNSTLSIAANSLNGGVLDGAGEVVCPANAGSTANVYRLNPLTGASLGVLSLTSGYTAAVLTPTGNIVCIPSNATAIRVVNSTVTAQLRSTVHSQTTPAYAGGVLVPDGNVVCVPYSSLNVTLYNPVLATLTQVVHGCGAQAFSGGVLLPTGNVVFVPFNSSNVGMFDPVARTYSNLVSVGATAGKYSGGILLPDGRVIMTQYNASNVGILNTRTPASLEFCRSPYFNKY